MSRVLQIIGILCLLPYGYALYYWAFCPQCQFSLYAVFYTGVLILALPFLLAFFAVRSTVSSARAVREGMADKDPVRVAKNSGFLWFSVILAVSALAGSWQVYSVLFPEVEEGRDRLGRICETEGSRTTCRPDPEARESALEQANRKLREDRAAQGS